MAIKALIFDFDGVILETEESIFQALADLYERHGHELQLELWARNIGGTTNRFDPYEHLETLVGCALDREALRRDVVAAHHAAVALLKPQPGIDAYVSEARARGLKLGVASSSSREWVAGHLDRLGLLSSFDSVWTRSEVTAIKPAPDLYLGVMRELAVDPGEAIAFEDSPNGIAAAQAAGLFCVTVPTAITRLLPTDAADLTVDSLASMPLSALLDRHAAFVLPGLTRAATNHTLRPQSPAEGVRAVEFQDALPFLQREHRTVVTTFRRSGYAQTSIVVSGPYDGTQALVVRGATAKLANLRRDPRCTLTVVSPDWRGYVTIEGTASISDWANTGHDELRSLLRAVYSAAGGGEHPDWAEYDRVMEAERRAVIRVTPLHVYGRPAL